MVKERRAALPHMNDRPSGAQIQVLIVHAMHADDYPGRELEPEACLAQLDARQVAAHYLISRSGEVWHLVPEEKRAWHAGRSALPPAAGGIENVNDISIGVELLGFEDRPFEQAQYDALAELTAALAARYPIKYVLGHEHVALPPGRKTDPGPCFSWTTYRERLAARLSAEFRLVFPDDVR